MARAEVLALSPQNDYSNLTVSRRLLERGVQLVQRLLIDRVGLLGPVEGYHPNRTVRLVADVFHGDLRSSACVPADTSGGTGWRRSRP